MPICCFVDVGGRTWSPLAIVAEYDDEYTYVSNPTPVALLDAPTPCIILTYVVSTLLPTGAITVISENSQCIQVNGTDVYTKRSVNGIRWSEAENVSNQVRLPGYV